MADSAMDAVLSRLATLERENRRLRRWGGLLLVLGLALAGMAMAEGEKVAEVVKARKFVVVDDQGKERGLFWVQPATGATNLALAGRDGTFRLHLGVMPDGSPGVFLFEKDGKTNRISMVVQPDGNPGLVVHDHERRPRAALAMDPSGAVEFGLLSAQSEAGLKLRVGADDSSAVVVKDPDGGLRVGLMALPDGSSALMLTEGRKGSRAGVAIKPDGLPEVLLQDREGKTVFKAPQ
jgi:hypothetical protein